jgi:hypothetical protein
MVPGDTDEEKYGLDAQKWQTLMPKGGGVVAFNDTEHSTSLYQVSIFHQMECLMTFHKYFARILESSNPRSIMLSDSEYDTVDGCTSYLTQMVLCAGDLSLESAKTGHNKSGRRVHLVKPFGVMHRCKDWRPVKEWLEKNI